MNIFRLLAPLAFCAAATSCFGPRTVAPDRHFILTAGAPATAVGAPTSDIILGLGSVRVPDYLLDMSMSLRKDNGELEYLENVSWAERMDKGIARVLANDLAGLIAGEVRLRAWRTDDVTLELYVTIEEFDVQEAGGGTLIATWRITAPGGSKVLRSGESHLTRATNSPATDPQNIAATLSALVTDLSAELAVVIKEVASTGRQPKADQAGPLRPTTRKSGH